VLKSLIGIFSHGEGSLTFLCFLPWGQEGILNQFSFFTYILTNSPQNFKEKEGGGVEKPKTVHETYLFILQFRDKLVSFIYLTELKLMFCSL